MSLFSSNSTLLGISCVCIKWCISFNYKAAADFCAEICMIFARLRLYNCRFVGGVDHVSSHLKDTVTHRQRNWTDCADSAGSFYSSNEEMEVKHEVDKVMRHIAGGNHVPRQMLPFILSEKAVSKGQFESGKSMERDFVLFFKNTFQCLYLTFWERCFAFHMVGSLGKRCRLTSRRKRSSNVKNTCFQRPVPSVDCAMFFWQKLEAMFLQKAIHA